MRVVFISSRPLGRCENITAVYNAYPGEKVFDLMWHRTSDILHDPDADYDLVVTDELVVESKAPVIMIYHGAALGKTYLMQRDGNRKSPAMQNACKLLKYAVTSSDSAAAVTTVAFQCRIKPDKVMPLGTPRMDALVRHKTGKTWIVKYLYAPTYRKLDDKTIPPIDLEKIDKLLLDNEIFIVKPHMVVPNIYLEGYRHIMSASKDEPTGPYLMKSDVLITDYSSIMFDAHAMGMPVVLFEKDSDTYLQNPGMCLSYPGGYASRHTQSEEELVELMREAAQNGPREQDIRCRELTVNKCDGHATERVIKLIEDVLNGHEETL